MKTAIDFTAIVTALWKKAFVIILCGLIAGVLAYMVASYLVEPVYTASVSIYLNNITEHEDAANIEYTDITAANLLVNTFIALLGDEAVLQEATDNLGGDINVSQLAGSVSVNSIDNTSLLEITAQAQSSQLAAELCSAVADIAPDVLETIVKGGSVTQLGEVRISFDSKSSDVLKNSTIGAMLGLFLSALIILIIFVILDTARGPEDLRARYDIPFLGAVTCPEVYSRNKIHALDETYRAAGALLLLELQSYDKPIVTASVSKFKQWEQALIKLAVAGAETGIRILLIDASWSKGSYLKRFIPDDLIVSSPYLSDETEQDWVIYQNVYKKLDIMVAGETSANVVTSLNISMLNNLTYTYDLTLIATPPDRTSDTINLNHLATGTILLAKKNKTRHKELRQTLINLESTGTRPVGIILADAALKSKTYERRSYESTPAFKNK